ncbi:NAD(P)-dependent oxidoreductase [Pseudarthrobacter sp. J1738]|uniref:NAD(P)-dependent oxidoreductase n=1 Tax=Pseudarthrobacter sp. J1738 TaxID=3420446 RepID=UPI003D2B4D4A
MKIAVYGATGMVGSRIAAEAISRGHEVTALSRRGAGVEGATAQAAELSDLATLKDVASKNDVVVLSVPPARDGSSHEPTIELHTNIANSELDARLFVVGGAGSLMAGDVRLVDTPGFPEEYKPEALTFSDVLEIYRAAPEGLDWTMQSPAPMIMPGERTGNVSIAQDTPAGDSISAEDFAVAALNEIEEPHFSRKRFTAAN